MKRADGAASTQILATNHWGGKANGCRDSQSEYDASQCWWLWDGLVFVRLLWRLKPTIGDLFCDSLHNFWLNWANLEGGTPRRHREAGFMSRGSQSTSPRDRQNAQQNLCQWRRQAFLYRNFVRGQDCLLKTANILRHARREVHKNAEAASASACCLGVIAATTTTKFNKHSYPSNKISYWCCGAST